MLAISAGSLDAPTGVVLEKHIFVAEKGDYYPIADGLPQKPGHSGRELLGQSRSVQSRITRLGASARS